MSIHAAIAQVVAPTISNSGNLFSTPQAITLSAPAGSIYYTLDGTNANAGSTPYVSPFSLFANCQIHAVAYTGTYSNQSVANIEVDPSLPAPIYWLNTSSGLTTTIGNPGNITSWSDLSGSGTSAAGLFPTYPTLKNSAINGFGSAIFNGSQFLTLPSAYSGFTAPFAASVTIFVVTKPAALTAGAKILDIGDGANGYDFLIQVSSGGYAQFQTYYSTSPTSCDSSPTQLALNQYQLVEAEVTGGLQGTVYINGVAGTTNPSMYGVLSRVRHNCYIGQASTGGNFYQGAISEVIIYQFLTELQRTTAEAWLLRKYQIPVQKQLGPIISVPGGKLSQPTQVTISSPPGTATYYTLSTGSSGTTPTTSSPIYTGTPITINYSQILETISVKNGVQVGSTATAAYTLDNNFWPVPSSSDMTAPTTTLTLPVPTVP